MTHATAGAGSRLRKPVAQSYEQAPGNHALAHVVAEPQIEMPADVEVVADVIARQPQRHDAARIPRPDRTVVVAADERVETWVRLVSPFVARRTMRRGAGPSFAYGSPSPPGYSVTRAWNL